MNEYVGVEKLIKKIQDMEIRGSWLTGRGVRQEDLVNQIIGTIVRTAMEDDRPEIPHEEERSEEEHVGYQMNCISEKYFSVLELAKHDFKLKEVLKVPTRDRVIPFRVEHVTDEKAYLVATDCVGRAKMTDINEYLYNFMKELPEDLLDICGEIEHKVNGQLIRKAKVTLLSHGNTTGCENCNGSDDMQFDGLRSETSRCKNDTNGKTCWYWEDTPYDCEDWDEDFSVSNFAGFLGVDTYGFPCSSSSASTSSGVCPVIAIKKKTEEI